MIDRRAPGRRVYGSGKALNLNLRMPPFIASAMTEKKARDDVGRDVCF